MPSAPHSHFWPAAAYAAQPQRADVRGDGPRALGAVEHDRQVELGETGVGELARHPADVRAGDERRLLRDVVGELADGRHADPRPALARRLERPQQPGVLLV